MTATVGYTLLSAALIVRGLHLMAIGVWEWDLARRVARRANPYLRDYREWSLRMETLQLARQPATTHGDVRLVRV